MLIMTGDIIGDTVGDLREGLKCFKRIGIKYIRYITDELSKDHEVCGPFIDLKYKPNADGLKMIEIIQKQLKRRKKYPDDYPLSLFMMEMVEIFYEDRGE